MDVLRKLTDELIATMSRYLESVGLEAQWQALDRWRQRGQNGKLLLAGTLLLVTLFITAVHLWSQRPDL